MKTKFKFSGGRCGARPLFATPLFFKQSFCVTLYPLWPPSSTCCTSPWMRTRLNPDPNMPNNKILVIHIGRASDQLIVTLCALSTSICIYPSVHKQLIQTFSSHTLYIQVVSSLLFNVPPKGKKLFLTCIFF